MAITLGELLIRIKGDASPMRQAIGEVKKESAGLTGVVQELKDNLVGAFVQPAVEAAKFGADAAGAIADVAAKAPALVAGMDAAAQATQEAEQAVQQLAQAEQQAAEAAEQAGREAQEAGQKAEEAGKKGTTWFIRMRESVTGLVDRVFNLKNALVALATAAGARSLWNWLIGGNAQLEQYQQTLATVLKDQEKAVRMLEWAQQFARQTPFEIPGIVEATVRLESYGLAAQKWLPLAGDMAAVMKRDVMQAVEAIGDAMTGELERLKEFGIKKSDLIAAGLKVNAQGQITDMVSMTEALTKIWQDRFIGGMDRQSKTFMGMISNVADFVGSIGRRIGGALFEDRVKPALQNLLAWLDRLQKSGQLDRWAAIASVALTKLWDVVAAGGNVLGTLIDWIAQAVGWGVEHRSIILAVASVITGFFIPAMLASAAAMAKDVAGGAAKAATDLAGLVVKYGAAAAAGWSAAAGFVAANAPLILGAVAIAGLVAAIVWLVKNWDKAKEAALNFAKGVLDYFQQLWTNLRNVYSSIGRAAVALGKVLLNVFNKQEREKAWTEFLDSLGQVKDATIKYYSDMFKPFGEKAEAASASVVGAMSGMLDKVKELFKGRGIDFEGWLKQNGFDPSQFKAPDVPGLDDSYLTEDRIGGGTTTGGSVSTTNEKLQEALALFERLKAKNDDLVNTYQKQAEWLQKNVLGVRGLVQTAEERSDIEDKIFRLMLARYEDIAERDNWTAAQRLKNLDAYVGKFAKSFDQVHQLTEMRRDLEKQAAEEIAKAQDERFQAALEAYDRETRGLELSAEQRRDIYRRLVVDAIAPAQRSAEVQKAIDLQLLDFEREIARERGDLAKQQAELANQLRLQQIEREQGAFARQLEELRQTYDKRRELAQGNAELLAAIDREYEAEAKKIREDAARAEMQDLLKRTEERLKAERASLDTQIAELRAVEARAAKEGVVLDGLADKIRDLEEQRRKQAEDSAALTRRLLQEQAELEDRRLEAALQAEDDRLAEELRKEGLTAQQIELLRSNSEQRKREIERQFYEDWAREQAQKAETYWQHEIAMNRATKQNLIDALKAVQQYVTERGHASEDLARKIEALEKEQARESAQAQQEAADRVREIQIDLWEAQGRQLEAAIAREELTRDQRLRDESLTEDERAQIIQASEARIAKIRQDFEAERQRLNREAAETAAEIEIRILEATGQRTAARMRRLEEEQRRERDDLQERFKDHADLQQMLVELDRAYQAERAKLLDENAREEAEAQARLLDLRFEMGRISREEYLRGLDEQIQAARQRYGEEAEEYLAAVRKKEEAEKRFADADAALEQQRYQFLREIGVISLRDHIANLEEQLKSEELTAEQRLALALELHRVKKQLADEEAAYQERLNKFLVASGQKSVDEQIADLQAKLANLRAQRIQGGLTPEQALAIDEQILATQSALNQIVEANHEYRRQLGEISLAQHLEWLEQEYAAEAENTERKKQLYLEIHRTKQEIADAERRLLDAQFEYERKIGLKTLDDEIARQEYITLQTKKGTLERLQEEQKLFDLRQEKAQEIVAQLTEQHGADKQRLKEALQAELERWQQAGDAGLAYVQVLKRAIRDLENTWKSTWRNMLSSVLSGQQSAGEALSGLWKQWVGEQADILAGAVVDGFTRGFSRSKNAGKGFVQSIGSGLAEAVLSGNWTGVLINEVVNLFTAGTQAQERLAAQARQRRENDADQERRLQELLDSGFTRSNTHRQEVLTEQAKYLFGLITVNHSRTIDVLTEETKEWIGRIEGYLSEFANSAAGAVGEALSQGTSAEGWRVFLRGLRQGIYEQIVDAVIDAFIHGRLMTRAIAPFIQALDEAMQGAMVDGVFDPAKFEELIGPALAALQGQLGELEGPFQAVFDLLKQLQEQMGVPSSESRGGRSGTQISEITGPTRDLLVSMLEPLNRLTDQVSFLDSIAKAIQGLLRLAEGDGIFVRLPSLVAAAGEGATVSIGTQWNVDRLEVQLADGVITEPGDFFSRLADSANRISGRTR